MGCLIEYLILTSSTHPSFLHRLIPYLHQTDVFQVQHSSWSHMVLMNSHHEGQVQIQNLDSFVVNMNLLSRYIAIMSELQTFSKIHLGEEKFRKFQT